MEGLPSLNPLSTGGLSDLEQESHAIVEVLGSPLWPGITASPSLVIVSRFLFPTLSPNPSPLQEWGVFTPPLLLVPAMAPTSLATGPPACVDF